MDHAVYFHIPFCTHRCAYCDFNTYAGQEHSIPEYANALCNEIEFIGQEQGPGSILLSTIYFGGGTPSLLSPKHYVSILQRIRNDFILKDGAEITMEANPGTVTFENLHLFRELGINRLSLGVQSANTEELRMLERTHDFPDAISAVSSARKSGFDNINLDLIYGLPGQTLNTWQTTVERILDLRPDHISAYGLTLEHGTPFGRWSARGLLPTPDPDLAAEMYELASEVFETAGYSQYEISNWSKPNRQCNHNLQYWRGLPYLGLGAGAHGYANGFRYSNVLRIKTYIERLNAIQSSHNGLRDSNFHFPLSPAMVNKHRQTRQDNITEFMITCLRLTE